MSIGGPVSSGLALPLLVEAAEPAAADPIGWIEARRPELDQALARHGAVLVRGLRVAEPSFAGVAHGFAAESLEYVYRSTPRTAVGKNVYTATEYPASATIPQHNENAYQRVWPMKLMFCCVVAAATGGETPLADTRKVTARLGSRIVDAFAKRGVMYVRNYNTGLDLTWQTVFQTNARSDVEAFCRSRGIDFDWRDDDALRTRQVCHGVAAHPRTGEVLFFNQAHLFHVSGLDDAVRESMLQVFENEDEFPRNAYYGDGSPIEPEVLSTIRDAYAREAVTFPWRVGDVLVVDNMLVSHGRRPFSGSRRVLVTMAEPHEAK